MVKVCSLLIAGLESDECVLEVKSFYKNDILAQQYLSIVGVASSLEECQQQKLALDMSLAEIVRMCPNLVWVHSNRAGTDHVLCPELIHNPQVTVTNGRGNSSRVLAEYVIQACLYFTKRIPQLLKQQQEKTWRMLETDELAGKTMGILGYGSIGSACARFAKAFEMKVLAIRKYPEKTGIDPFVDENLGLSALDYLLEQADFVVVSIALTPETKHLLNRSKLQLLKKSAVLINIGRGDILDEEALIEALQGGYLRGAALDAFSVEPLPTDSPLWSLSNVLISPHNAFYLPNIRLKAVQIFVENCRAFMQEEALNNIVDKVNGY